MGKVKHLQSKLGAKMPYFNTVSYEGFAQFLIANTQGRNVFLYFKEQLDTMGWAGNMPSPPMSFKSSILTKGWKQPLQSCKGSQLRDWLSLIVGAVILLGYRNSGDDVCGAILMHKKGCLEDQRIRQGPADLLTKSFMDEEEINGIRDSCFEMRIYWQTKLTVGIYSAKWLKFTMTLRHHFVRPQLFNFHTTFCGTVHTGNHSHYERRRLGHKDVMFLVARRN